MALRIYDTLRRDTVAFTPRDAGHASLYVCGPTVQSGPHVGHGRATVVFDVLRRHLTWTGLEVLHVTNVTDVDDKIILRAARERSTTARVAAANLAVYNAAMSALGNLAPHVQPLATGHLFEMQALIGALVEQGKAYEADGNVLFRVREFPVYGQLSGRRIDDLVGGEDVVGAEYKDDPLDFAMWKAAKEGEPAWPSPWGDGRPGWHIECAVMASTHLGHGFDIHGGGLDLVFPHHENEAAQYEAAHGAPFARYWMHNGMVRMGEEKMSKSLGNIVGLGDAIERWGRGPLRLWYVSAHHRSPLTYDEDRLTEASAAFDRLLTFLRTVDTVVPGDDVEVTPDDGGRATADHVDAAADHVAAFRAAMDDDLNAPAAVAALHDLVSRGHELIAQAERGDEKAASAVRRYGDVLVELADDVLGLGIAEVHDRDRRLGARLSPLVETMLADRSDARAERDFARADLIRDRLAAAGVVVEDRPDASRWYVGDPRG